MRILCHTGVRRPTANFCRLPNCISWRWKLGPLPWFVFLGSVWTWDLHRRSFISLVILVPERGCFPQTGHQIRRLVRQAVPFSQCFGEARINRHPEIWENTSTELGDFQDICEEVASKTWKGALANSRTKVLQTLWVWAWQLKLMDRKDSLWQLNHYLWPLRKQREKRTFW